MTGLINLAAGKTWFSLASCILAAGAILAALGLMVMGGWLSHWAAAVQVIPAKGGMAGPAVNHRRGIKKRICPVLGAADRQTFLDPREGLH